MYRTVEHVMAASTSRNADSQSAWFDVSDLLEALLIVDVTVLTAADTIDFTVEVTDDAESSTYTVTHTTFTQITAVGKAFKLLTNFGGKLRLKWNVTLAGAQTTTFSAKLIGKFQGV